MGISESRLYKCVQGDRSNSLDDTTPENLDKPSYWAPIGYNFRDENKSEVKLSFILSKTIDKKVMIPAGFKVSELNNEAVFFITLEDAIIPVGETTIENIIARGPSDQLSEANTVTHFESTFSIADTTLRATNPEKAVVYTAQAGEVDRVNITAEQAANRDIVVDDSVTSGTYECIAPDFDIEAEKATIENGKVPCCFKRKHEIQQTDGSTKTVYFWQQKWKRIADLVDESNTNSSETPPEASTTDEP